MFNQKLIKMELLKKLGINKDAVNNAKTLVSLTIASINMKNNTCVVNISYRAPRSRKMVSKILTLRVTKLTMDWLTVKKDYYDKDGNLTDKKYTGYQRYLLMTNRSVDTPIKEINFSSINHSEDYYENPFKININTKYESATLNLVYHSNMTRLETCDPNNPEETSVTWIYKRNKYKQILTLPKKYYRRIDIY